MMDAVLFCLVVMTTYFVEGIVGFGSVIAALPILSLFLPFKTAVVSMTNLAIFAPGLVVARDWKQVDWKQYRIIMLPMLVGLPIGMLCFSYFPERTLKVLLGVFLLFVAGKYFVGRFRHASSTEKPVSKPMLVLYYLFLFAGGIIQGAFSSGGPFVVIYAARFIPDKTRFRCTLAALWVTLSTIVLVKNIILGFITPQVVLLTLASIPFVFLSIHFSNIVHKRVSGGQFMVLVNLILLLAGALMLRG